MNRREWIASMAGLGVTAALPAKGATAPPATEPGTPRELMGQEAESGYFSEAKLAKALGTAELKKPPVQVVAFNFPSWHPSPYMERMFGKGWTEFDTLRNARPLFPGHTMPHYPLWGYYDESDPVWAAREIELASTYGVDAWMIDWYWHDGLQFYHEQLENGLLKAENRARIKFAVMWANHDWKNVYPARSPDEAAIILPQTHSLPDFERVANYCAERYFSQPNYLRVDDAPVFALFDPAKVVEQMGESGLRRGLEVIRERAAKLGHPKVHLQVCNGFSPYLSRLRQLGFDSAAIYGTLGWTYDKQMAGQRIPYGKGAFDAIALWDRNRRAADVPYYPTCSVGWDDSPRFGGFAAVAIDRSPDQFERLLRAARHFSDAQAGTRLVYIGAWNEWTEDGVLLPDSTWGYSYLEALRRAIRE